MSEKTPNQASSKEYLDQLSALEESMASFGMGVLDSERGVILKDWSAQDFANIYVRFRPHLINHARKFLREESHAEEVVQDAFLYLMTALPELDSELGVLRFLKWKTKMLCLDVIRSTKSGINNNLMPLPDDVEDESQPVDSLERAEDAAIIRLAFAKLTPRHREVLLATVIEEKSSAEVAQQMGLGENALRQLIFRARASFRRALIGEASTEGLQVADLLSLARKRSRAGWYSSLALLAIVPGFLLSYSSFVPDPSLAPLSMAPRDTLQVPPFHASEQSTPQEFPAALSPSTAADSSDNLDLGISDFSVEADAPVVRVIIEPRQSDQANNPSSAASGEIRTGELNALLTSLGAADMEQLSQKHSVLQIDQGEMDKEQVSLKSSNGLDVAMGFNFDSTTNPIQYLWMTLADEKHKMAMVPRSVELLSTSKSLDGRQSFTILASEIVIGDVSGEFGSFASNESIVSRNAVLIEVTFDSDYRLINGDVSFSNKS